MKLQANEAVVITGGNGFVGQHLARELESHWKGVKVISWDLPEIDITKPETYRAELQRLQPAWIVHLAAISSVVKAGENPGLTQRVNVEAAQQLLEAVAETSSTTRVFVTSSADIYGSVSPTPLPEQPLSVARPRNAYGASKLAMEEMIEERFSDRCLRVRPFPHIGPGQGKGFVTADFASQIAAIEKGQQEPVLMVGNLEAQRDFTDVRDVVRAYRLLMEQGKLGDVYHVASGQAVTIQAVLDALLKLSEVTIDVQQDAARMRPSDIPVLVGDASKLTQLTGWQPSIPLAQSLQDVLDWWRAANS